MTVQIVRDCNLLAMSRWALANLLAVAVFLTGATLRGDDLPVTEVRVVRSDEGWQLLRNGEPYPIRGVGGSTQLDLLAEHGANSIRTWSTDDLDTLLDAAHERGLSVCVGLWLGHERHGFDYNNADDVAGQIDMVRRAVERYKHHPAVLMWALGNEMEGFERGDNAAIWSAINNLATLVKQLDPHRPTMTVVAEIGGQRVKNIHRLCPAIDIVGINSYAGAASLPQRYREAGGTKPYIITEFGPAGPWEVEQTDWKVAREPTSTQKAEQYRRAYEGGVLKSGGLSLGSYAFLWGHKQESTATWFGILLPDGQRLAAADTLRELWTGQPPDNRCPVITSLKLQGPDKVQPESTIELTLQASDPEGDALEVRWVLQAEPNTYSTGGDAERPGAIFGDAILESDRTSARVRMPAGGGGYRVYAYVSDGQGGAAVANVPVFVDAPLVVPPAPRAELPLHFVPQADDAQPPFVPTGWMGNTRALRMDEQCDDRPHSGDHCWRIEYRANDAWAGIVWQNPPGDWGDRPGGWNLTGAKRLTFMARGGQGGEVVGFKVGTIGDDKPFPDSAQVGLDDVKLGTEWTRYTIDLTDRDLSRIKSGLVLVIAGQGRPVVVDLDDVRFE